MTKMAETLVGDGGEGVYAIISISVISLPPRLQVLNDHGNGRVGEW